MPETPEPAYTMREFIPLYNAVQLATEVYAAHHKQDHHGEADHTAINAALDVIVLKGDYELLVQTLYTLAQLFINGVDMGIRSYINPETSLKMHLAVETASASGKLDELWVSNMTGATIDALLCKYVLAVINDRPLPRETPAEVRAWVDRLMLESRDREMRTHAPEN